MNKANQENPVDNIIINRRCMKGNLLDVLKNPNDQLIAVDMDGVLCEGEFWGDGVPRPIEGMIDQLWKWYKKGAHIIIYTARQPEYYKETVSWLIKFGVPFHGISMFIKPGADVYIDDKALNIEDV